MSLEHQLSTLLSSEIGSLDSLLSVLNQELEALTSTDVDAIEKAATAKNVALAAQAEATQTRRNLVTGASSFDDSNEGLQQLIATCENQDELTTLFSQLTSLARQCQDINRSNGRLITQKQQQARSAISILRQGDKSTPTYSGQGKTTAEHSTRTLGKA